MRFVSWNTFQLCPKIYALESQDIGERCATLHYRREGMSTNQHVHLYVTLYFYLDF